MNRGMGFVTTPLVIFRDANTFINPQAVREIVKCFNHPQVGCVAGEKRVDMYSTEGAVSGGEGLYWKYESWLKKMDYQLYSAIGAAGELFAIRTPLYEEMPEDTLLDDFMLSLRIAMKQYTIAYCDTAYAVESGSADMKEEEKRKVRIAAGGLQSVYRLKELLNPLRYGILSFQYVSHRVLRWSVTPVALFLLFPLNILLVVCSESLPVYFLFLLLQSAFYLGGVYGSLLSAKSVKNKFLYIPYYFLFMNINVIKGFFYFYIIFIFPLSSCTIVSRLRYKISICIIRVIFISFIVPFAIYNIAVIIIKIICGSLIIIFDIFKFFLT